VQVQVFRFAKQTAVKSRRGKLGTERSGVASPVTRTKKTGRQMPSCFLREFGKEDLKERGSDREA